MCVCLEQCLFGPFLKGGRGKRWEGLGSHALSPFCFPSLECEGESVFGMSTWQKTRVMSLGLASPECTEVMGIVRILVFGLLLAPAQVGSPLLFWEAQGKFLSKLMGHKHLLLPPRNSAGALCSWGKLRRKLSFALLLSTPKELLPFTTAQHCLRKGEIPSSGVCLTKQIYILSSIVPLPHSSHKMTFLIWDLMSLHIYSPSTRQEMSVYPCGSMSSFISVWTPQGSPSCTCMPVSNSQSCETW